jgi:hypothetical protein
MTSMGAMRRLASFRCEDSPPAMKVRASSRRLLLLVVAVTLAGVGIWIGSPRQEKKNDQEAEPKPLVVEVDEKGGLPAARREGIQGGHPLAAKLNAQGHAAQRDLEILREMLLSFTTSLKVANLPPLGDNRDITAALTGNNRKKLVLIPPSHPSLDNKGRLLDRWGTPYHFHARSAESFDLRSAGPDKALFTSDDVTWSPR